MSARARAARRLSSLLTTEASLHVRVQYDRAGYRYAVHWTGGPTAAEMYELAAKVAGQVSLLDIDDLAWLRTEPTSDPRGRYDYGT